MILDGELEFSNSQVVTATAISTNQVDTGIKVGTSTVNLGGIQPLFLVIQCDVTATADGAATVDFSLESDSTSNLATSPTVHSRTGPIAKANLVGGNTIAVLPLPFGNYERYLGLRYTVATGPLTAGSFSAFLTRTPDFWKPHYANNPPTHN